MLRMLLQSRRYTCCVFFRRLMDFANPPEVPILMVRGIFGGEAGRPYQTDYGAETRKKRISTCSRSSHQPTPTTYHRLAPHSASTTHTNTQPQHRQTATQHPSHTRKEQEDKEAEKEEKKD